MPRKWRLKGFLGWKVGLKNRASATGWDIFKFFQLLRVTYKWDMLRIFKFTILGGNKQGLTYLEEQR
jgi:hypothetical protein